MKPLIYRFVTKASLDVLGSRRSVGRTGVARRFSRGDDARLRAPVLADSERLLHRLSLRHAEIVAATRAENKTPETPTRIPTIASILSFPRLESSPLPMARHPTASMNFLHGRSSRSAYSFSTSFEPVRRPIAKIKDRATTGIKRALPPTKKDGVFTEDIVMTMATNNLRIRNHR